MHLNIINSERRIQRDILAYIPAAHPLLPSVPEITNRELSIVSPRLAARIAAFRKEAICAADS